ncbi:hypothetical protein ACFLRC_02750 [Candidatus Altiarchaeota archaeon]
MKSKLPGVTEKEKKEAKPLPKEEVLKGAKDKAKQPGQGMAALDALDRVRGLDPKKKEQLKRFQASEIESLALLHGTGGRQEERVDRRELVSGEFGDVLTFYSRLTKQLTGQELNTADAKIEAAVNFRNAYRNVVRFRDHVQKLSGDGPDGDDDWRGGGTIRVEQIGVNEIDGLKGESAREFLEETKKQDSKLFGRMKYVVVANDKDEVREINRNERLQTFIRKNPRKVEVITQGEHSESQKAHYIRLVGPGRNLLDTKRLLVKKDGEYADHAWASLSIKTKFLKKPNGEPYDFDEFMKKLSEGKLTDQDVRNPDDILKNIEWNTNQQSVDPENYHPLQFKGKTVTLGGIIKRITADIDGDRSLKILVNTGLIERVQNAAGRLHNKGLIDTVGEGVINIKEIKDETFNPVDKDRHLPSQVQVPITTKVLTELFGGEASYEVKVQELKHDEFLKPTETYHGVKDDRAHKYPLYSIHVEKKSDSLEPVVEEKKPEKELEQLIFGDTGTGAEQVIDRLNILGRTDKAKRLPDSERKKKKPAFAGMSDAQTGYLRSLSILGETTESLPEWPDEGWWGLLDAKTQQQADWWYDNCHLRGQNMILGKLIPISGKFKKKRKPHRLDFEEMLDLYQGLELVDVFGEG